MTALRKPLLVIPSQINSGSADLYMLNLNLDTIMPTDTLAPTGARPSAGTMLTTWCIQFTYVFLKVSLAINSFVWFFWPDIFQNGRQDLKKSCGTLTVDIPLWTLEVLSLDKTDGISVVPAWLWGGMTLCINRTDKLGTFLSHNHEIIYPEWANITLMSWGRTVV